VDARFGRGIVDLTILARLAVDRADVDDTAPAAFDHAAEGGLGHVETAAQIDAHDVVPVVEGHACQRAVAGDPGVVDDDVDRAEVCGNLCTAVEAGPMVADVPAIGGYAGALGEGARLFVIACIISGDADAHILQRQRNGLADAAAPAGDDCYACHEFALPHNLALLLIRARVERPQVDRNVNRAALRGKFFSFRSVPSAS
jgi:hypothetical protein